MALIDDNPLLRGRLIHGQRILGGIGDIDGIARIYKPDTLLVTAELEPGNRELAMAAARRLGLSVFEWRCGLFEVEVSPAGEGAKKGGNNGKHAK